MVVGIRMLRDIRVTNKFRAYVEPGLLLRFTMYQNHECTLNIVNGFNFIDSIYPTEISSNKSIVHSYICHDLWNEIRP